MKKYVGVTINKLNTMRNKPLSMKPGLILKKYLQISVLHDMAISKFLHKKAKQQPKFSQKRCEEWSKKENGRQLTVLSNRNGNEVYYFKSVRTVHLKMINMKKEKI